MKKLFKSSNFSLINESQYNFQLPSDVLMKRKDNFLKFMASQSLLDYFTIQQLIRIVAFLLFI